MGSHSFTLGPSAIQGGGEFWDPTHKDGDGGQKSSWCGYVPDSSWREEKVVEGTAQDQL